MRQVWTRAVVALVGVLAVVGLTAGCEPRTGAAAYVEGTRISEANIDKYVVAGAKPFTSGTTTVDPRSYALRQVVLGYAVDKLLFIQGGLPSTTELETAKKTVVGTSSDSELAQIVEQRGFTAAFEPVLVNTQTKLGVLTARITGFSNEQVQGLLTKANLNVKINPAYGTWDPSNLSISNGPAVGDFLRTSTAAS